MCFSFSVADLYQNSLFDSLFTFRKVSNLKSTGLEWKAVKTLFSPQNRENCLHYCTETEVIWRENGNGQFSLEENGTCQIKIYKYDTLSYAGKQYDEWPPLPANWQILTSQGSRGVLK